MRLKSNMAQISPKQNISFSIDGILNSGNEDDRFQRNRETCSTFETISFKKAVTTEDGNNIRGDNSPNNNNSLISADKKTGQPFFFLLFMFKKIVYCYFF